MPLKLFDDGNTNNDDVSKIEIDQEFAKRYEHNKQREALQRYEELQKKGLINDSESDYESESESSDDDEDEAAIKKKDVEFFNYLVKVKNRDPSIYHGGKFFVSDSDSDDDNDEEEKEIKSVYDKKKKNKPVYLKDVKAKHSIEGGDDFDERKTLKKSNRSYGEEQEELKEAFLDAVKEAEEDGEDEFLKVKERKNEEEVSWDGDDAEFGKKLGEYFGEGELDEDSKFLWDYFGKKMWRDKDKKLGDFGEDEVDELLRDEEEVERQEKYEESYNFRYEENAGDRVLGHSRKVDGSVRKKDKTRKEQRKNKEERMKIAEMERKEELKHLKNLKKKEMKEKMKKVMEVAGFKDDDDFLLDLDDLEGEFDPDEYDKMMKNAFNEKYYDAQDVDPGFGNDDGELEKPDFDKEDELLGLPKDWDVVDSNDGFLAARERSLKLKEQNGDDDHDEELRESGEEQSEESKRKRKRKMSLVQEVKQEMMEEYYKLDYEGTVGDLKTRFKYAKVDPNRYGLKTEEILAMDDGALNQYVSIKKLAPYRDKEWKVSNRKRYQRRMLVNEPWQDKLIGQKTGKKKYGSKDGRDKSTSILRTDQDGKEILEESNADTGNLSRKAKRRRRQAELKLPHQRLIAYGKA